MERVVLRHRAVCQTCRSKLPPRSEVWWDEASRTAICLTCARTGSVETWEADHPTTPPAGPTATPDRPAPRRTVLGADRSVRAATITDPAVMARMRAAVAGTPNAPTTPEPSPAGPAPAAPTTPDPPPAGPPPAAPTTPDPPPAASPPAAAPPVVSPPPAAPPPAAPDRSAAAPPPASPPADRTAPAGTPAEPPVLAAPARQPVGSALPPGLEAGDPRLVATLRAAEDHGIRCLHRRTIPGSGLVVDHLVVAPNGLWVVTEAPEPQGRVERRDLGDWFSSEPRLYIGGEDASRLHLRAQHAFDAVEHALADTMLDPVPRQGVLCFVEVAPAWFTRPFELDRITVTWRRFLVDPMLGATTYGPQARDEFVAYLASRFPPA